MCKRYSCIYPNICKNLDTNHEPLTNIYKDFVSKKAIFGMGNLNKNSIIDFENHINNIITNDYSFQLNNQYQLFEGNIRNRFLTLLKNL